MKWLFLECDHDLGIFEKLDEDKYKKFKQMSKYKKNEWNQERERWDNDEVPEPVVAETQSISQKLDITVTQNEKLI